LEEYKNSGGLDEAMIYFESKVKELADEFSDFITEDVGLGFMRGLRIKDSDTLSKILESTFKNRVIVLKAGRNTLRFLPPLTITREEIDEGFKRVQAALSSIA
jgi:acetylornithine aminotransferase